MTAAEILAQLRGIHLPIANGDDRVLTIVWWPLLLVGVLALTGILAIWFRQHAWRRTSKRELALASREISSGNAQLAWQRLSLLVRRLAYLVDPQPELLSATGTRWLELLDQTLGMDCFVSGPGSALVRAPYILIETEQSAASARELVQAISNRLPNLEPSIPND